MDWPDARRLIESTMSALNALQARTESRTVKVNGIKANKVTESLWNGLRQTTLDLARDAVLRAPDLAHGGGPRPRIG